MKHYIIDFCFETIASLQKIYYYAYVKYNFINDNVSTLYYSSYI